MNPIFANEKPTRSLSEFEFLHNPNDKNAKLGIGSFASVKLAQEKNTGNQVAVKIINMHPSKVTNSDLHNIKTEIAIHRQLDHPNIVRFHDYIHKDHNVYLILEFAESGNLYSYIHKRKTLLPEEIFRFFHQTCLAIQYLHQNDVLHRDIKPENLLLDKKKNLKLCDFGWATRRITEKRTTFCGTYEYMAPEIVHKKTYDYRVDIWSLGVLLYELIHKEAPYKGRSLPEITKSLAKSNINFSPNTPPTAKDLILKILKTNPADRLSIAQILSHPYVQSHLSPVNYESLQVEEMPASPKQAKSVKTLSISGEDLKLKTRRDKENFKSEIITTSQDGALAEILSSKTRKNSHNHLYNSFNLPCSAKSRERSKEKAQLTQEREKGSFINIAKSLSRSEVQQKGPLQDLVLNGSTNKTTEENISTLRDHVKSSPAVPRKVIEKSTLDEKKRKIFEDNILPQAFKSKIDNILLQVSSHTTTHKLNDRAPLFSTKNQITAQTPSGEPVIGFRFFEENAPSSGSSSSFRIKTDLESTRLNTKNPVKKNFQKKISLLKTDALSLLTSPTAQNTLTTRSKINSRGSDILESESNFALPEKFSMVDVPKTTTAKSFGNVLSNADQNKFMGSNYQVNEGLQRKNQKELDVKKKQILKISSENLYIPSLSERKNQTKRSNMKDKENSIKLR